MANANTQPTHRLHLENEALPVSREDNVDYSDKMNRLADQDSAQQNSTTTTHPNIHTPSHIPGRASIATDDANRESHPSQGVAEYPPETHGESLTRFDERPGLNCDESASNAPQTAKPGIGDKIIGKTEKLAGKIVGDPVMEVEGAIRSKVGKV